MSRAQLATQKVWDYIVVGTGMGGATVGHALAAAGHSVLFLERGHHLQKTSAVSKGDYPERQTNTAKQLDANSLAFAGRYWREIDDITAPIHHSFVPFIGSGTGGSSALYGMALERFFPADFEPRKQHPGNICSSLPANWPVNYTSLAPYYEQAEALYQVRGSLDPLRPTDAIACLPPAALSPPNQVLFDDLQSRGLHPYHLPIAGGEQPGCRVCQGYLCAKRCKNDSAAVCLYPAVTNYGAELLTECDVDSLVATTSNIEGVRCRSDGEPRVFKARRYVVACGALETPRLLLESASAEWPTGVGNQHDLVGRNLMRHYIDLYALLQPRRIPAATRTKELAFNDFYLGQGEKLGSVQSFGNLPPADMLVEDLQKDLRRKVGGFAANAFTLVKPLVRVTVEQLFARTLILASIVEDLPFPGNRVQLSPDLDASGRRRLQLHYQIREAEEQRIAAMRKKMKNTLKGRLYLQLRESENNQRIAHACGTCRFGDDASSSVCDANHKVHGVDNLYLADSSIFPSSGGINPSLTIAALSLRLADHLIKSENNPGVNYA